jgi:hypothetical protein
MPSGRPNAGSTLRRQAGFRAGTAAGNRLTGPGILKGSAPTGRRNPALNTGFHIGTALGVGAGARLA